MSSRFFAPARPRLFAHRGACRWFPENTLPAFQAAWDAGSRYFELDVWATQDGHLVCHHDQSALRTCGQDRQITAMTLADCQQLDAGHGFTAPDHTHPYLGQGITIPTLAEVLTSFPEAMITVEVKQQTPPVAALLATLIRNTDNADRVLLAALDAPVLAGLRQACPNLPSSFSFQEVENFYQMLARGSTADYHPPGKALQIPQVYKGKNLIFPAAIAVAHNLGMEIHVWTVNEAREMRDLLDLGVDGIMSDDPRLLIEVAGTHPG